MPYQRHAEQQRLCHQLIAPTVVTESRCAEAKVGEPARLAIH
jgi:hypothetical protein